MRQKVKFIILVFVVLFFFSCFKEEEIIELPQTSVELQVGKITKSMYNNQIFYDLESNSIIKSNANTEWDLGFACADTTWHIVLNNANTMFAGNSQNTNFEQVTSVDGITMHFDNSGGYIDSLAINNWLNTSGEKPEATGFVYVIDRGYDEHQSHLGYKKVVFQTPENNNYIIRHADLNGSNEQTINIEKDETKNYVCFSFDNETVDIEPPKTDWTLLFSSYQTMLYTDEGEATPYLVRGVLLNPYEVKAVSDTALGFSQITINDTLILNFSTQRDIIGYNWKFYDFDNGLYSIVENMHYILKTQDECYYKLRFISFYCNANKKGFPIFETSIL